MQNKLVIFDLDGVLIESRELHYEALNDALRRIGNDFVITREEQEYIGYTIQHLSDELQKQTNNCIRYDRDEKGRYCDSFEIILDKDRKVEVLEVVVVKSKKDLSKKHREWVKKRINKVGEHRVLNKI